MKLMILSLGAALVFAAPANAQTPQAAPPAQVAPSPEALAAANDLLAVMSKDMVTQMTTQMMSQMWPLIESQVTTQVGTSALKEIRSETERVAAAFTLNAMKSAPAIYANHFTIEELREITAFYKTPTGAKTIAAIPQVMVEFYATLGPRMPELETDLRNAIMDVIAKYPK